MKGFVAGSKIRRAITELSGQLSCANVSFIFIFDDREKHCTRIGLGQIVSSLS